MIEYSKYSTPTVYQPYLSCSAIDRWLSCQGSSHLARVRVQSDAADAGTDRHEETLHPERCPEAIRAWFGTMPKFEEAFGVDCDGNDTRFFGAYTGREYPCPSPIWLVGSADARHCTSDTISVGDLKTGMLQTGGALGNPGNSGQLRGLAYLILRYGESVRPDWRPTRVRLAWFKSPSPESMNVEDAEIPVDDLRAWGDKLVAAISGNARALVPTLNPGSHCDRCPSFDACPAQGGAIRRVLEMEPIEEMDAERLIEAFSTLQRAERAAETARRSIAARLRRDGDAQGERMTLRLRSNSARRIDPDAAYPVLREMLRARGEADPDAAAAACFKASLSQESIKAALGADLLKDAMWVLEEAGAVTKVETAAFPTLVKRK